MLTALAKLFRRAPKCCDGRCEVRVTVGSFSVDPVALVNCPEWQRKVQKMRETMQEE